jgi:uncharacterized cupin superfamily protein
MESSGITSGEGYAVAPDLDSIGEGYGFRKLRRELGLTGFGANVIVMPPAYSASLHFHDEQEELYFVHRGAIEITFGDGSRQRIGEGGAARIDASTHRGVRNLSDSEDAVYLAIGGKGGYVGRDGRTPEEPES